MRVLVRFADLAARERALERMGGRSQGPIGATDFEAIELSSVSVEQAVAALLAEPGVMAAEPDERVFLQFTPNDTYYASDPITGAGQWGLRRAQVDRAWDVQRGSPAVTVAVIDTGVDASHPDLAGAVVSAPRFLIQSDTSCPAGTTNRDDNGHGTHVAGIIGASGNNAQGIAGVAFGVRIMPIKALDCVGGGSLSDIARAITYATDSGARVVNISLGATIASQTLQAAVNYALSRNVVVVSAAGNCGSESGTTRCPTLNAATYPAAYPGVLGVGASDPNDVPTTWSTAGSYVGIAAPGTGIVSTFPTYDVNLTSQIRQSSGYAAMSGTSQATPLAAGVAALLLSHEPALSANVAVQRLRASADDIGPLGWDAKSGDGRVNAFRALTQTTTSRYGASYAPQASPSILATTTTTNVRVSVTNTSNFTWPAAGMAPVRLSSHWFTTSGTVVNWDGPRAGLPGDVPAAATVTVDVPLQVPATKGSYVVSIDLVQEGVAWFSAQGVQPASLPVTVVSGYAATYQPQSATLSLLIGIAPQPLSVTVSNTGLRSWPAGGATPVHLASHLRDGVGNVVVWDGPRGILQSDVAPGQSSTISLPLPIAPNPGSYSLELDLVQEGVTWFSNEGVARAALPLTVTTGYGARYTVASAPALLPGERVRLQETLLNTGAFTWAATGTTPVRLAYHVLDSSRQVVVWDGTRSMLPMDVAPNASVDAPLAVDVPLSPGTYVVRLDLVREGVSWFSTQGVAPSELGLTVTADRRASLSYVVTAVSRSAPQPVMVTVTNTSTAAIGSDGGAPVNLSSHWLAADGTALLWDGPRASLPRLLLPGERASVNLPLASPPQGTATLVVDLVQEGLAWFGAGSSRSVTLTP